MPPKQEGEVLPNPDPEQAPRQKTASTTVALQLALLLFKKAPIPAAVTLAILGGGYLLLNYDVRALITPVVDLSKQTATPPEPATEKPKLTYQEQTTRSLEQIALELSQIRSLLEEAIIPIPQDAETEQDESGQLLFRK